MGIEDLDNNGAGAAGGDGGLDLSAAGESISADLFGSSTGGDDNGSGTDDVNLDDGAGTGDGTATTDPAAMGTPAAKEGEAGTSTATGLQAPKTWRPEAAAKFATLPPEVQQEVLKREEDIFKGLEGYKADASIG